jgi:hypothetical protein
MQPKAHVRLAAADRGSDLGVVEFIPDCEE